MGWPSLWPAYDAHALAVVPEQLALIVSQLVHLGSSLTVQKVVNIFQHTADDGQTRQAAGTACAATLDLKPRRCWIGFGRVCSIALSHDATHCSVYSKSSPGLNSQIQTGRCAIS